MLSNSTTNTDEMAWRWMQNTNISAAGESPQSHQGLQYSLLTIYNNANVLARKTHNGSAF